MNGNSTQARSARAHRQGHGQDGRFREVERDDPTRGLDAPHQAVLVETLSSVRDHSFYPDDVDQWPALSDDYEYQPQAPILAAYATPDEWFYVAQFDQETGDARGIVDSGVDDTVTWREFNLRELEARQNYDLATGSMVVTMRDTGFEPLTADAVLGSIEYGRTLSSIEDSDTRWKFMTFTSRVVEFSNTVDGPFPNQADRDDFFRYAVNRFKRDNDVADTSGYALALDWLAHKKATAS